MGVAVITGASSGIGRATARIMADKGWKVYDLSRSDKPQDGVTHIACDVTNRDTIESAIKQIADKEGRIDVLVLCAGMGVAGSIEFTTATYMVLSVSYRQPFHLCAVRQNRARNAADSCS